jgi:hypothetical protein
VVASPSKQDPDYFYSWIRDASLVMKVITDLYTHGLDNSLRGLIDAFASSQARIQQVTNPSGSITTGGLGEPKFQVNEVSTLNFSKMKQVFLTFPLRRNLLALGVVLSEMGQHCGRPR